MAVKYFNLMLVVSVSLVLAIGEPANLFAGPCQDAAQAEYNAAMAGFDTALLAGFDAMSVDRAEADRLYGIAIGEYNEVEFQCQLGMDIALAVDTAYYTLRLAEISWEFTVCVTACGVIGAGGVTAPLFLVCSDACL